MPRRKIAHEVIRMEGVRQNNLKNITIEIPVGKLVVVTGLSGSGKSSLAFETLYAEGQRRYIETFSPYARQFFDRMDKPSVDKISGIPPAIAIEQRNSVKSTRSTVGTMTEICDHMKVLWPYLAELYCKGCGELVRKENPEHVWTEIESVLKKENISEVIIAFDLELSEKLGWKETVVLLRKQGFLRFIKGGKVLRLEEVEGQDQGERGRLTMVQDRISDPAKHRSRVLEALGQAFHFGKGRCVIYRKAHETGLWEVYRKFSEGFHCATCDLHYKEPKPSYFSFNHPLGACSACKGFGRIISIDYDLAIPDRSLSLSEGAIKPWQTGHGLESQADMERLAPKCGVPFDVPFEKLEPEQQSWVMNGDPDYGTGPTREWPHAWYGVRGYFRWLESKAYKMHVRVLLSRYRSYTTCPECHGSRLQPESLLHKARGLEGPINLPEFYKLPADQALDWIRMQSSQHSFSHRDPVSVSLREVESRLFYLVEVGLGYLTLDRATRSLSGGETERVNLTTCLGSKLVNTLFVLDEPSVGLHSRDTERLVRILEKLRDNGNTVVVVEHEAMVMEAADQIIDLGPGHGEEGGRVLFQGTLKALRRSSRSLTGKYLSGRLQTQSSRLRPVRFENEAKGDGVLRESMHPLNTDPSFLHLKGARMHNLQDLDVKIPLRRFTCLSGVSGSGKTSMMKGILHPLLSSLLKTRRNKNQNTKRNRGESLDTTDPVRAFDEEDRPLGLLHHWEQLDQVIFVDQNLLGRTPRSNPCLYVGAFDEIRKLFAAGPEAVERGFTASHFSFNSRHGQCERCRGAGFEKIEMQFLSDVYIRCPICDGRRYRAHILEASIQPNGSGTASKNIAEVLALTVDQAQAYFSLFQSTQARKAMELLKPLVDVGLGYLQLGRPLNTLSGGESQRIKLASYLSTFQSKNASHSSTLFLFDEPTTGLHFADIDLLLDVFQKLVDAGHSILVIEHNLDVLRAADWIIDLGPEAGREGGKVVAEGTPEDLALSASSYTGRALKDSGFRIKDSGFRIKDSGLRIKD